jgi:phosphoglycolate phosphatase
MTAPALVIFDMDGTLIDSQKTIIEAMRETYGAFGTPAPDDEAIRRIIGLSLPEVFRQLSPDLDVTENERLVRLYKESFIDLRARSGGEAQAPLYPGARDALDRLAGTGVLLSVATGKARRGLDHAIEAHRLHGLFSFTQTADDARSKPHPEMVLRCVDLHGVSAAEAVMIGDTSFDMQMARSAGTRALGVSWGYHPDEMLHEGGAEQVVDHFDDLEAALSGLFAA